MEKQLLSIIIPIYNAGNYLNKCLDKIINQTYKNIEIILVNDGSTDDSKAICEEYSLRDSRIVLINKKNAGPAVARKEGYKISTGSYITFIDSDDLISFDAYSLLIQSIYDNNYDILEFGYTTLSNNGDIISKYIPKNKTIIGKFQCSEFFAQKKYVRNYLWNKIFRRELFNNIDFTELYMGEDTCILTQVYYNARRVGSISLNGYYHIVNNESLCNEAFNVKKLDTVNAGIFIYLFYEKCLPQLCDYISYYICTNSAQCYCMVENANNNLYTSFKEYLLKVFFIYYNKTNKNSKAYRNNSVKRNFFIWLFSISPSTCSKVYHLNFKLLSRG